MKRRLGFTLTELLIVIAIIVILATLLIPNLVHMRRSAKRTVCGSNLRNVASAMIMYTGDNNSTFPPHVLDPAPDSPRWWGHDRESREEGGNAYGEIYFYVKGPEVFQCPTLKSVEAPSSGNRLSWGLTARNVGYGYNAFFLGRYDGRPLDQLTTPPPVEGGIQTEWSFSIASVVADDQTIMLADATVSSGDHGDSAIMWWPTASTSSHKGAYMRHLDTANVATVKGTVRSLSEDDMYDAGGQAKLSLWDPRFGKRP